MTTLSRRDFFAATALGVLATRIAPLGAKPLGLPIGCQTYPVRMMLRDDFPGTIRQLADAGFERIELCSPLGYQEFSGIAKYTGPELRTILGDAGMACESCHFSMRELRQNQAASIAWAKEAGLTQMLVASLGGPQTPTMDDVKKAADEYNKMAEQAARAGLQQGLHNENFETSMVEGRRTYDVLFELLDPRLVKFQFQISTARAGFDAVEHFTKYPGRFMSMHVQGLAAGTKANAPVGQDSLDWKKIFAAAKIGGIRNYFVEMPFDLMKASVPFLKTLT